MNRTESDLEEHLQHCKYCKSHFLLLTKSANTDLYGDLHQKFVIPFQISCKSWFCPQCSKTFSSKIYVRAKEHFSAENCRLMTLTTDKTKYTTEEAILNINKNFNSFITTIKKLYKNLKFFKVLEISKGDSVHLHVLINQYIPAALISKIWLRFHNSYIVKLQKCTSTAKAISYLLKYLSKSFTSFETNKIYFIFRRRRYSFSRATKLTPKDKSKYSLLGGFIPHYSALTRFLFDLLNGNIIEPESLLTSFLDPDTAIKLHDELFNRGYSVAAPITTVIA